MSNSLSTGWVSRFPVQSLVERYGKLLRTVSTLKYLTSSVVHLRRICNLLGVYISLLPRGLRVLLRHEYKSRILKYFIVTLCISFISITLVRDFYSLFDLTILLMGPILAFGGRYCSRCCSFHLSSRRCSFPERILQCRQ